jgi:hypothetical protein
MASREPNSRKARLRWRNTETNGATRLMMALMMLNLHGAIVAIGIGSGFRHFPRSDHEDEWLALIWSRLTSSYARVARKCVSTLSLYAVRSPQAHGFNRIRSLRICRHVPAFDLNGHAGTVPETSMIATIP